MLHKKDFKAIARILKRANEDYHGGTPTDMLLSTLEEDFIDYLSTTNPNFDRYKFVAACVID